MSVFQSLWRWDSREGASEKYINKTLIMSRPKTKIAHSLEDLEDQVILTLKDRPILNQHHLDQEEDDILQNEDLQHSHQVKHNTEIRAKLKILADVSSSHMEAKLEGRHGILPHYDDYTYQQTTIEVDEGGIITSSKPKKSRKVAEDYETVTHEKLNTEYAQPISFKKTSNRTKTAKELLNFLQETAEENQSQFKRSYEARQIIEESIDHIRKKRMLESTMKSQLGAPVESEEDLSLMRAIERSQKAVKRQNVLEIIKEAEESVGELQEERFVEIELNPIAYRPSQPRTEGSFQIKDAVRGTSSAMLVNLPSQRLSKKVEQKLPESFKEVTAEEMERMREEVSFLQDRKLGIGLATTLEYLRDHKLIGQEEQVGRFNDKPGEKVDPNDRIRLEYRNSSGKLMTPKEAYRHICATFHGQGPGKNKVEKRKKRELQELRMKEMSNVDGKLMTLLERHQERTKEAHMVLDLGGKKSSQ